MNEEMRENGRDRNQVVNGGKETLEKSPCFALFCFSFVFILYFQQQPLIKLFLSWQY